MWNSLSLKFSRNAYECSVAFLQAKKYQKMWVNPKISIRTPKTPITTTLTIRLLRINHVLIDFIAQHDAYPLPGTLPRE